MGSGKKFDPRLALKQGRTPREKKHIKDYAQQYGELVIDTLLDILEDDTNYPRDRIQAGQEILNRGYGKAADGKALLEINDTNIFNVQNLSTRELMTMLAKEQAAKLDESESLMIEGNSTELDQEEIVIDNTTED